MDKQSDWEAEAAPLCVPVSMHIGMGFSKSVQGGTHKHTFM